MKAFVCTQYGSPDVLQLQEVEKPTPKDNEVLIKIHAATVTAGDCEMRSSNFPIWLWLLIRLWLGLRKPRQAVLGQELAGEIEAVGKNVKSFKTGDQVFAATGFGLGAYAEYRCMPETGLLALKPANATYDEAAAVPVAGLEALHFLQQGHIQSGQKVLIYGAGGSIGTFAVQLAHSYGAEVTGVDRAEKLAMLSEIGATHVIDYTQGDFTTNGEIYDVIFDVIGKTSFSSSIKSLKKGGHYLLANAGPSKMIRGAWASMASGKKVVVGAASPKIGDLISLKALVESGKIKAVIDRRYPLEQIADAHRYVDSGHKRGNVVITVCQDY